MNIDEHPNFDLSSKECQDQLSACTLKDGAKAEVWDNKKKVFVKVIWDKTNQRWIINE